ncbi:MAG: hypothetical protein ACTHMB_27570, partial [Candidatus Binatia bacterium]
EFRELVPVDKIDPVYFDSSYYLAPSKGAEKPYRLMAETPEKIGRVASADRFSRERKPYGCPLDVAERRGKVVDLMAALKQSLERSAPQREPATYRVRTATKTARKRRKA